MVLTLVRAALVGGALSLAACAGGTGAPATDAASAGASGGPAAPAAIAVKASEYRFDPDTVTVQAGRVTFSVTNVGEVEHEFEIFEGDRVVDEVENIVPGLTRDLTVTLEAGDYTYVCKLSGHEEAGMKGTLTVTGS